MRQFKVVVGEWETEGDAFECCADMTNVGFFKDGRDCEGEPSPEDFYIEGEFDISFEYNIAFENWFMGLPKKLVAYGKEETVLIKEVLS